MKPQYLVYDHNRFSAKMLVKFHYFSKKLSKMGKRTAWQLHGTCTPLILMSSRVIRVYHYTNMRVMAAAASSCRLRCADSIARPLPGVLAYQPAGSPHIERVRLPYAAPCAFFVKVPGLVSPQRHTMKMYFCGMARNGGRSCPPVLSCPLFSCLLSHAKGHNLYNQLGFQSAPQLHI